MNIWDEVDKIQIDHSLTIKAILRGDYDVQSEFKDAHYQRGQLLEIIDQFRPRRFDPDNRETWPIFNKKVLAWNKLDIHKIVKLEETSDRVKWLEIYNNLDECVYPLDYFKWWQSLPPGLGFPGEEG